jgi:hypothetical protein
MKKEEKEDEPPLYVLARFATVGMPHQRPIIYSFNHTVAEPPKTTGPGCTDLCCEATLTQIGTHR